MIRKPAAEAMATSATPDREQVAVYLSALRIFVARRLSDREMVEDLVQEAYVRLLARTRDNSVDEPQAYLFRIARNLLADLHRGRARTSGGVEPIAEDTVSVPAAQEDNRRHADLQAMLNEALAELSSRCREVFIMRRFDGLDTGEVAQRLGITPRMVQKHLVTAVTHLYQRLGGYREPL